VFEITPVHSSIKFGLKALLYIADKFDKSHATLKCTPPDKRRAF
jgi:hypothetical protein